MDSELDTLLGVPHYELVINTKRAKSFYDHISAYYAFYAGTWETVGTNQTELWGGSAINVKRESEDHKNVLSKIMKKLSETKEGTVIVICNGKYMTSDGTTKYDKHIIVTYNAESLDTIGTCIRTLLGLEAVPIMVPPVEPLKEIV